MKKFIAAAAAAILASAVSAQTTYDSESNLVFTGSNETDEVAIMVSVWPQNNCKPQFILSGTGNMSFERLQYKLRIDKREAWNVVGVVSNTDEYAYAFTDAPQRLINELRRGGTARIQLELKRGGYDYYSFNLSGFSVAYSRAKAACIAPSNYFSDSNSEYFL